MPQRALREHKPARPSLREAASAAHQARISRCLQARDRWLGAMLHEHKILTSHQITALAWPSARAANLRLLTLYRWRIVDRFQPFRSRGSAPMHYVLDVAGAAALAHQHGIEPARLGYRREREIGRAHSLRLAHTIGVNEVMAGLAARGRQAGDGELVAWWSEERCAHHFGEHVRPDAYGRWAQAGREIEWFLEFDCGTEALPVLASKLTAYQRLAASSGIRTPVLFTFPTTRRETTARDTLAVALRELRPTGLIPIATATLSAGHAWLPLTSAPSRRLALTELAGLWPAPAADPAAPAEPAGMLPLPTPLPPAPPVCPFGP
jgi:hypothetical protein